MQNNEEMDKWARDTLDAVSEALDKAAAYPGLIPDTIVSIMQNTDSLIDALMTTTVPEQRDAMRKLIISTLKIMEVCLIRLQTLTKKQ